MIVKLAYFCGFLLLDAPSIAPHSLSATVVLAAALLVPALLALLAFEYVPLARTFVLSMQRTDLFGRPAGFVGFDNFVTMFASDDFWATDFWATMGRTAVFAIGATVAKIGIGVLIAVPLSGRLQRRWIARVVVLLPMAVSVAVAGVVFRTLLQPEVGLADRILQGAGIPSPGWLVEPTTAMASVVIVDTWTEIGFTVLILLAARAALPDDVNEAASLDGAGTVRRLWSITLPLIAPTILFLTVYRMIAKLSASVQAGELPDIVQVNDVNTMYMRDAGITIPAEDLLREADAEQVIDDMVPITSTYYTIDGTLNSLPFQISQPATYIRKDALEASGTSLDAFPDNVEDLAAWAAKSAADTGKAGLTFHLNPWWFEELTAASGLDYCTPENGTGEAPADGFRFTRDEQIRTWTTLQSLFTSGAAFNPGTGGAAAQAAFFSGDVSAILATSGAFGDLSSELGDELLIAPFPSPDGAVVPGGNSLWTINDLSDAERTAAGKFLAYAGSPEVQADIFTNTGYLPSSTTAIEQVTNNATANQKAFLDQLSNTPTSTASAGCHSGAIQAVRGELQPAIEEIVSGADVTDVLSSVEKKAAELVKEYNERAR